MEQKKLVDKVLDFDGQQCDYSCKLPPRTSDAMMLMFL